MLKAWTEVMPLFFVRWLAKRHCEIIPIGSKTVVQPRHDTLFIMGGLHENKKNHIDFLSDVICTALEFGWKKEEFMREIDLTWHALEALDKATDEAHRAADQSSGSTT